VKDNLKDILTNLNPEVDQETLMRYLEGKLSPEEQHEVEKNMVDEGFEADALEGLQQFSDNKKLQALVQQLNDDLKRRTAKKKQRRLKQKLELDNGLLISILLLLLLIVLAFFIIRSRMN